MERFLLAAAFQRARPDASGSAADAALDVRLAAALERTWDAHPRTWMEGEAFAAFLGERLDDPAQLEDAPLADLYLACACIRGLPEALASFERLHGATVTGALLRLELPADRIDEVRSRLLQRLLLAGDAGEPPRLAQYRGAGALAAWLRVLSTREGLTSMRARADEPLPDEERLASLEEDLEMSFVKENCRAAFKEAFGEAIRSLPARERTLLKQHYLDGLSAREIARMRRVHHGTAARWLEDIREAVFKRTRASLQERLQLDVTEFESMIRVLQSRWDVTIGRFLDPASSDPASRPR